MARGTVNKVILIGRLGADPEIRYTPGGSTVATFNLATNRVWKDKEGKSNEDTTWHRVVAWNRLAEVLKEYVKKGHRVYVDGRLQTRDWEDQSGQKRYVTEVVANEIQMLESATSRETADTGDMPSAEDIPPADNMNADDESVPF